MRRQRLRGVIRGKVVPTTVSDAAAPYPHDLINRQFRAERPNRLCVSDDALKQALYEWRPAEQVGLSRQGDRRVRCVSIRYSKRLAEASIEPSVGSVGDYPDNALSNAIDGLDKTELVHRPAP